MWTTLIHNGVYFPPLYVPVPSSVKILYESKPVSLTPEQEEPAYLYAKYIGTEYIQNKKFNKNFFKDWKKILGVTHIIKDFEKVDFSQFHDHILKLREQKQNLTKEEKVKIKEAKDQLMESYKNCIVDGVKQPVGNYIVEPPDIFKGRGDHPKNGMLKKRIRPEDITINLSKDAPIPKPNVPGNWGNIIHERSVIWLASWKEDVTGKMKYVFLGQESEQRMSKDQDKFDLSRKLKKKRKEIRNKYISDLNSSDLKTRQIASAVYLIDRLALRVGNEKGEDQADTVGVTSLKINNVSIDETCKLELDFLGKDSIRYHNKINIDSQMCKNIREFMQNKSPEDELFDLVNSNILNNYLTSLMKNLTAKVFRTFNSSYLFSKELSKINEKLLPEQKITLYNKANKEVACLCNHKKKVSKNFKEQLSKMDTRIKELSAKPNKTKKQKDQLKLLKEKKKLKKDLRDLSLGTSKINYIDPRITVAFFKKNNLNIEKVFTKTLLRKFKWALEVDKDWKY
jgi:DNA topoisomerase-1